MSTSRVGLLAGVAVMALVAHRRPPGTGQPGSGTTRANRDPNPLFLNARGPKRRKWLVHA